uniref:Chitin-binding type-2 domain-containing protein n=1 Tax=Glossina pallidipes TaxID=7398 RepID=A0A1B0AAI2_GLOPL
MFSYNLVTLCLMGFLTIARHETQASSIQRWNHRDYQFSNPNLRSLCPPKNEQPQMPLCKLGSFAYNPDPENCGTIYKCYLDANEFCEYDEECADNMVCHCSYCNHTRGGTLCLDSTLFRQFRKYN